MENKLAHILEKNDINKNVDYVLRKCFCLERFSVNRKENV